MDRSQGLGWGLQVVGWVDSYDLDQEGEFHSAGISFSICVLGTVGFRKGAFLEAFPVWERSGGETGRQLPLKQSVLCACDQPREQGAGSQESQGPFQPVLH